MVHKGKKTFFFYLDIFFKVKTHVKKKSKEIIIEILLLTD